ncbi:MAG: hypothetical protein M9890_03365 [Thermomicrobiales bacterium]|nr:hypothetical protein [Thermomicrobiales bacterium]
MNNNQGEVESDSRPKAVIWVAAMVIIAIGVFLLFAASRSGSGQASQPPTAVPPTPMAAPTVTTSPGAADAKATALQQQELARQTAVANPAKPTKPSEPMTPTADSLKPSLPELGILDMHQSSASIRGYYVSNLWQGQIDDRPAFLQVSAGATKADTGSLTDVGIVAVVTLVPDDHGYIVPLDDFAVYEAPGNVGPLTIASVDGNTVLLTTAQGDTITFDLTSRAFQSQQSSAAPAPTEPVDVAQPAAPAPADELVADEPTDAGVDTSDAEADSSESDVDTSVADDPTEVADDAVDADDGTSHLPPVGIQDSHQGGAVPYGLYVSNYWQAPTDDGVNYIQVNAGARKAETGGPSSVGIVAILTLSPDDDGWYSSTGVPDVYEAPGEVGPLTIVDVEGTTIILQTEDGGTINFDLVSLSFN